MYTSVQALGFHLPKVDPSCSSLWNTYAGESITLKSDMDQGAGCPVKASYGVTVLSFLIDAL